MVILCILCFLILIYPVQVMLGMIKVKNGLLINKIFTLIGPSNRENDIPGLSKGTTFSQTRLMKYTPGQLIQCQQDKVKEYLQ